MSVEMTEQERDLLLELIENAEESAIRSMGHADTREFKDVLRSRLALLASTEEKIRSHEAKAA